MDDGPGIGHRSSASRSAGAIFDTLSKKSSAEFAEPFFQVTYLWVGFRQRARPLVCGSCLVTASKPTEQVGACRMCEVVVPQLTACEERIDEHQPGRGPVVHRDGRGTVKLDDRRGLHRQQRCIHRANLAPGCCLWRTRLGT